MIHLIGVKKDLDLHKRTSLSIPEDSVDEVVKKLKEFSQEGVIINTCNRTELYINSNLEEKDLIARVFSSLNWEKEFRDYIFYCNDNKAAIHLLEVSCGFHSKILGEDQILGQVRTSYLRSKKLNFLKNDLDKLFTLALACGKDFKSTTKLFKTPVSYSSISAKTALEENKKDFLILGFGKMAQLSFNYLIGRINTIDSIYIVVRDRDKVLNSSTILNHYEYFRNGKIKILSMDELKATYSMVDTIICCTSSLSPIVKKEEVSTNNDLLIFDLSLPINVESQCKELANVTLYNLDDLQFVDSENKALRKQIMNSHRYIIEKYYNEFKDFIILKETVPTIRALKEKGNSICKENLQTFINKKYTKDNEELVNTLLNSTSNRYINRAIELLKEETLNGNSSEVISIIEKIFLD